MWMQGSFTKADAEELDRERGVLGVKAEIAEQHRLGRKRHQRRGDEACNEQAGEAAFGREERVQGVLVFSA